MLRIGSIGAGGRGVLCKLAHKPGHGAELVAVCDTSQDVLDDYRREFGDTLTTTTDYRQMLSKEKLDAVFVTSPDFLHEEHAIACIQAGCAVYLEKPLAITIDSCDKIIAAARQHKVPLYVGHNMRFFPVMLKMRDLVREGAIGQVQAIWCRHFIAYGGDAYFKDWHSEQKYVTGLLLQKAAHDIDMIHWFADAYTTRVVGMGMLSVYNQVTDRRDPNKPLKSRPIPEQANWPPLKQTGLSPVINVEDHNMILMQLSNGIQASYTQCHYTPDSQRNYTIIGTEGRIENFGDHSTDEYWAQVRVWQERCGYLENGTTTYSIPPLKGTHGGADPLIVEDFLTYVRKGTTSGATAIDARMSVAAGCKGTESIRSGNTPQDVPPMPE